jgi:hypothetical protein
LAQPLSEGHILIYISIPEQLQLAIDEERLFVLEVEFDSDETKRLLVLHPELKDDLAKAATIPRLGRLKADLEAFVRGQEVTMSFEPREHRSAYMAF